MSECTQITDAAFVYLRGIHTLNMTGCKQATITDAAFVHLRGIHTLEIYGCSYLARKAAASLSRHFSRLAQLSLSAFLLHY